MITRIYNKHMNCKPHQNLNFIIDNTDVFKYTVQISLAMQSTMVGTLHQTYNIEMMNKFKNKIATKIKQENQPHEH